MAISIDHDAVTSLMIEATDRFILPRWKKLDASEISRKASDDVVTIADRESETFLAAELTKLIPGSAVVGEEGVHDHPEQIELLQTETPAWVIDPLDGTSNFAAGEDRFAVMVCLIANSETLAAWIFDPIRHTLVSAEKSAGAQANGQALHLNARALPAAALSGALLTRFLPDRLRPTAQAAASQFRQVMMSRCGGYDYQAFAQGRLQFLFYYRTLVWDHAPGSLIVTEAGGVARRLDGSPYRPTDSTAGLLVADCDENWHCVHRLVVPSLAAHLPADITRP